MVAQIGFLRLTHRGHAPRMGVLRRATLDETETKQLLTEIRDAQRDLLAEYRRVANEALKTQTRSAGLLYWLYKLAG